MTATPEQITASKAAYDAAQTAQQVAKKIVDDLKAAHAGTVSAYETAKALCDALKPATQVAVAKLKRAEADVTLARAEWHALAPAEAKAENSQKKGFGNAALLVAVKALLADKPDGATNQSIYDGLMAAGVTMAGADPRGNLNSYLSRWGAAGALLDKGSGKWGMPTAAPSFLGVPAVPDAAAPSFLSNPPVSGENVSIVGDILGKDFPGVEPLNEAGFTTKDELAGKTQEDLVAIPGIGAKTAEKILAALAA